MKLFAKLIPAHLWYLFSFFPDLTDWPGIPPDLDAAVAWNGSNYFLKGCTAYVYSSQSRRVEQSVNIEETFKIPCNIDAAVNWEQDTAYFFKGNKFYEYSRNNGASSRNPIDISILSPFLKGDVEATGFWKHIRNIPYIFKGPIYYRSTGISLSTVLMIDGWPGLLESDLMPKCGCSCTANTVGDFLEYWKFNSSQYDINLGASSLSCSTVLAEYVIDSRNVSFNLDKEFTVSTKFTNSISFSHINGVSLPSGTPFTITQPDYKDGILISNSADFQNFTYGKLTSSSTNPKSFVYNCPSYDNMKVTCTVYLCKERIDVPYTLNFLQKTKNCVCPSQILFTKEWASHLDLSVKQTT